MARSLRQLKLARPKNTRLEKRILVIKGLMLIAAVILIFYFFQTVDDFKDGLKIKKKIGFLYTELLSFKDNPLFQKHGFDPKKKYYKWKQEVEILVKNPIYNNLVRKKNLPEVTLFEMALAYYASRGKETYLTISTRKEYDKVINDLKEEEKKEK